MNIEHAIRVATDLGWHHQMWCESCGGYKVECCSVTFLWPRLAGDGSVLDFWIELSCDRQEGLDLDSRSVAALGSVDEMIKVLESAALIVKALKVVT